MAADALICPHCLRGVGVEWSRDVTSLSDTRSASSRSGAWWIRIGNCPLCGGLLVAKAHYLGSAPLEGFVFDELQLIYPELPGLAPPPAEVAESYAADFVEAANVLPMSAKASAALSRRLLQRTIREMAGISRRNLVAEIDTVIASGDLPSALADDLHAVRNVGNFAAHPLKDTETGAILDVEPGEAEWLLELLRDVFEFYFVAPARREARRAALNDKLRQAGKPNLAEG